MPYTKALIAAVPVVSLAHRRSRLVLAGDIPSSVDPPSGCRFRTRCPYAISECSEIKPVLREIKPGHHAACIRIGSEEADIEAVVTKNIRVQQAETGDAE
jgi:peptide/nickel transport system ATP-binding protein